MAKCDICGQDMLKADGCNSFDYLTNAGKKIVRIKYGEGSETQYITKETHPNCHDCGCKWGHYHHIGCDMENCPICAGQLISCGHMEFLKI